MLKAIAIDDEPVALDILRIHAYKISSIQLTHTFCSARAALKHITTEKVDLIYLDINMPDMNGLEFAALISPEIQIIFTTAYADYAITGFDLAITDFLLKPISAERFSQACLLAQNRSNISAESLSNCKRNLFVKDGYNWVRINPDELMYAKAEDNYVNLVEEKKQTLVRMTIDQLLVKLNNQNFVRIHKSYIVNINQVRKIESYQVSLNDMRLPVSKTYSVNLKKFLV